jgi:hypothetical protein
MQPKGASLDLRCFRCGYSLKAIAPAAVCPECGLAAEVSRAPERLICEVLTDDESTRVRLAFILLGDGGAFAAVTIGALGFFGAWGPPAIMWTAAVIYVAASAWRSVMAVLVAVGTSGSERTGRVALRSARLWLFTAWTRLTVMAGLISAWLMGFTGPVLAGAAAWLLLGLLEMLARALWLRSVSRVLRAQDREEIRSMVRFILFWLVVMATAAVLLLAIGNVAFVGFGFGMTVFVGGVAAFAAAAFMMHATSAIRTFIATAAALSPRADK